MKNPLYKWHFDHFKLVLTGISTKVAVKNGIFSEIDNFCLVVKTRENTLPDAIVNNTVRPEVKSWVFGFKKFHFHRLVPLFNMKLQFVIVKLTVDVK